MAAAASVSYAGAMADAMELDDGKFYLFDSGATHVLLPMKMLEGNDKKRAARIRLRLAAGKDTIGLVVDGEISLRERLVACRRREESVSCLV